MLDLGDKPTGRCLIDKENLRIQEQALLLNKQEGDTDGI
jgi:hypothetical protein